jgi:hypothetical protein
MTQPIDAIDLYATLRKCNATMFQAAHDLASRETEISRLRDELAEVHDLLDAANERTATYDATIAGMAQAIRAALLYHIRTDQYVSIRADAFDCLVEALKQQAGL